MTSLPESVYQSFMVCSVCCDSFKDPKLLPCRHSFCVGCLERHVQRSTTATASLWFLCPQCRVITDVPSGGLAGFQSNSFISRMQSHIDLDCQKALDSIEDKSNQTNHSVRSSSQIKDTSKLKQCELLCGCGSDVGVFCTKCERLLCAQCIEREHKGHSIQLISEKEDKEKDFILGSIHDVKKEVAELVEGITYLEKYKKQIRKSHDEAVSKVNDQALILKKLLDRIQKDMLTTIDNAYNEENDKVNEIIKQNKDVVSFLKSFSDFSEKLLKDSRSMDGISWRHHIEHERDVIMEEANHDSVTMVIRNPVDIKYKPSNMNLEFTVKRLMGSVHHGYNLDMVDKKALKIGQARAKSSHESMTYDSPPGSPKMQMAKHKIHKGKLVNSFSIFTDGSHYVPHAVGITITPDDNILIVDRNNKCVKFFSSSGGMHRKILSSENVWGVQCLKDGNIAVTDKTVHVFDEKGRVVRVLRQQPRDSHGVTTNSNGDFIVTDCASRCIYILAEIGGTIKRIITQRGGKPFMSPNYVAINQKDDIIISDSGAHTVTMLSHKGELVREFGSQEAGNGKSQLNSPMGVCVDSLGNIIVCDKGNNRVILLDHKLNYMCTLVEGVDDIDQPQGVCIDRQGHLVVVQEGGRVRAFKYREQT